MPDEMVEKARKIADDMFFGPHKPECDIPEDQTMTVRYGHAVRVISAALAAAEAETQPVAWQFATGQTVEKFTGEAIWHGVIVARYLTTKGKQRYVVEVQPQGFQMIAVPEQLRASPPIRDEAAWPIETAPKLDGYQIEAKVDGWPTWAVVFWSGVDSRWVCEDENGDWIYYPVTVWRPTAIRARGET